MFGTMILTPLVTRILVIIAVLTALVGGGWYLHHSGYQSGYSVAQAEGVVEMSQYKEAQRKEVDRIREENRMIEEKLQAQMIQGLVDKENEIKAINDTHDRLIRGMRERPSRRDPAPVTIETPVITTFECTRAVSTGEELSREDGEFLIGEAASADILRQALKQCREAYAALLIASAPIEKD